MRICNSSSTLKTRQREKVILKNKRPRSKQQEKKFSTDLLERSKREGPRSSMLKTSEMSCTKRSSKKMKEGKKRRKPRENLE
jgi:hypothetical protein